MQALKTLKEQWGKNKKNKTLECYLSDWVDIIGF